MNSFTKAEIRNRLIESLAASLYLESTEIDPDKSFTDLGLDSIVGVEWIKSINKEFDLELSSTKVYDYATINELTSFLLVELRSVSNTSVRKKPTQIPNRLQPRVESKANPDVKVLNSFPKLTRKIRKKKNDEKGSGNGFEDEKIAIIGISGRYPQANNLEQYWENLQQGKNSIVEIPASRWDTERYYDPDTTKQGKVYSKWLGMLDDVDCFDPLFFQISPAEAETMDPQHRIFLEESYKAFEDAGYARNTLSDQKCGVYMGIMSNEYSYMMSKNKSTSVNTTANSFAIGAARIAYFMNLKGPAIPFDTACSSSLVAIHVACQGLLNIEIDMALAGGVSLYLMPESYLGMCQAGMLSPEGQCKTFDDAADGFVPGEGAGAVVLKRLKDAERDNDHIHGVIIASGINQDGKTNGITAPSVNSQIALEREIYSRYNIDPASISYVEAHGTGTKLGDPIELEALSTVFSEKTDTLNYCAIGSVKSNIGHTSGAAGVASLQKVLLCMKNKILVPTLNVEKENRIFDFKKSPFYISREKKAWLVTESDKNKLRRAAISSFGFSGTNAHLVVEEYPQEKSLGEPATVNKSTTVMIPLSARTTEGLYQKAVDLYQYIESNTSFVRLVDMAYTLQIGREEMKERLGIVAGSVKELQNALKTFIDGQEKGENVFTGKAGKNNDSLNILQTEKTFAKLVHKWVEDRRYTKLIEIWVNGSELDWYQFYSEATPKRINLPTYPFAKESYWIPKPVAPEIGEQQCLDEKPDVKELVSKQHFYPSWEEMGISPSIATQELDSNEVLLILDVTNELHTSWNSRDQSKADAKTTVFVKLGNTFQVSSPNTFQVRPEREEDFQELIALLESTNLLPSKIIHESTRTLSSKEIGTVDGQLNTGVYALFYLCRALMGAKNQKPLRIASIFTKTLHISTPLNAALGGFFKTLALENPKYQGKVIEVPVNNKGSVLSASDKLTLLVEEFKDTNWNTNEIQYHSQRGSDMMKRYIRTLKSFVPEKNKSRVLPIKQRGVYIISGGIGGLGYIISEYLVKNYHCNLVLFGRSPLNKDQKEKLGKLKKYDNEVLYHQTDVTDLEAVKALVKVTKDTFSRVNGILHSAGVSSDSFLLKKLTKEMDQVIDPKVFGAINLDKATKDENLDFFVLFSSIAGVLGNFGQCDYAYANHFLDSFAEYRGQLEHMQQRFGKTISINWPYWEEGGFGLPENEIEQGKKHLGLYPMDTATGLEYFEDFLCSEHAQGIALYGAPFKINSYLEKRLRKSGDVMQAIPNTVPTPMLLEKTVVYLTQVIGDEIKLDPERIDSREPFDSFGIDSIVIGRINIALEKDLGPQSKTLLYEYPSIQELAEHLLEEAKDHLLGIFNISDSPIEVTGPTAETLIRENERPIPVKDSNTYEETEPMAIIGMHGKYPKSKDLAKYWENLKKGKNLIDLVPESRWEYKAFYHEDPEKADEGKIYGKWGGFINDVDKFDPEFFNIPKEEARMMDPQERLFLESVWATIEDAGYTKDSLSAIYSKGKGSDVGVFVGVTTNTYNLLATDQWNKGNYLNSSALTWSIANRVSYLMDFQGPSMPVDTACSSSLVAIHMACESLRKKECQVAIAGGVNLYLHPSKYHSLCKKRMLAQGERNYSFGAGDDGFVPGEGVGSILLKPLSKAMADKDHIYAVVKGSTFAHSGRSNGYSAPNPNSQSSLIDLTLRKARVHPETIGYVEGHGTGTQLGDSLEILALTNAFRKKMQKKQICPVGSVKANMGHAEAAAGIAGVTKILLQLKHSLLAPTINSETINPNIDFEKTPFYLQHELSPWKGEANKPRRALINSFGAGGVNACLIIEEYGANTKAADLSKERPPYLVILSAKNKESLINSANQLLSFVGEQRKVKLANLAYTLQIGREAMQERLAFIVTERKQFMEQLKKWKQNEPCEGVFQGGLSIDAGRKNRSSTDEEKINASLEESNLIELAQFWVDGANLDWGKLYEHDKMPQRISVPTYPFSKQSYWITDNLAVRKEINVGGSDVLHPLVSHNISTLQRVGFSSLLSDSEYYAKDHKVNGVKLFPGAGFLEIASVSGSLAGEKKVAKIKEIVWMHPLTFENGSQWIQTYLKQNGSGTDFQITSLNDHNEQIVHSEGKIRYQNGATYSLEQEETLSIKTLIEQCPTIRNGSDFYNSFSKAGFEYGMGFRTIREFYASRSFALGKLEIAENLKADFEHFMLHPSILDGALQTVAGLLASTNNTTTYLPFSIGELEVIRPLTQTCYAYVEFADQGGPTRSDVKKFNIKIVNRKGTLLVKVKNFYTRALSKTEPELQEVLTH